MMWPLVPTAWTIALQQHARARIVRSGQRIALARVNMSKVGAHRARNPGWAGWQYGHTRLRLFGSAGPRRDGVGGETCTLAWGQGGAAN
jgi:hypothetical protein